MPRRKWNSESTLKFVQLTVLIIAALDFAQGQTVMPAARAASSTLRWVSSAAIASSRFRPILDPCPAIRCQLVPAAEADRVDTRVKFPPNGDKRDIGIYHWRLQARDLLENAIRGASGSGVEAVPILASPEWLDSGSLKRFQWTGIQPVA